MKLSKQTLLAASAIAITGSLGLGVGSASATTDHCDSATYPNKVEINGGPSVDTGLAPGTEVCIKAGNQTVIVVVDADGFIHNDSIWNKTGNALLGISYYAHGGECEYPCGGPTS